MAATRQAPIQTGGIMIDKSTLPNGCDCDTAYAILHGSQETPGSFRSRYQRGQLTEQETAACANATSSEEAFATLYPDYVGLHEFREEWHDQPAEPRLTVVTDDDE